MASLLIRHKVEDFSVWKKSFNSFSDLRNKSGELSAEIFREEENPNAITLLFEWDTFERAKKYMDSPDLQNAMKEAGVTGPPEIVFLNKA
jgi:quinol monooxygenase YgiN